MNSTLLIDILASLAALVLDIEQEGVNLERYKYQV